MKFQDHGGIVWLAIISIYLYIKIVLLMVSEYTLEL